MQDKDRQLRAGPALKWWVSVKLELGKDGCLLMGQRKGIWSWKEVSLLNI